MDPPLLALARSRPVVLDGAMGTAVQERDLTPSDFQGLVGCNEILVLSRPDVIRDIHRSYLAAGADVLETDSFGANAVVLGEYGLADRVFELNRAAALLARSAADETPGGGRFVSGSMGPGTKLPSLGQIGYRELYETYREQAAGLLAGGVDALQVETCQDPLQARAAILGAADAMAAAGRRVALFCLVTFEPAGTLLLGTDPAAVAATLARLPCVDVLGVNCSSGPDELRGPVRDLSQLVPLPLAVLPNAGLPETRDGRVVYPLGPEAFASRMREFVVEHGVAFVGGCCGTGPAHIAALSRAVRVVTAGSRAAGWVPAASSLFQAVPFAQSPAPLLVGERTNANGSREFRNRLAAGDLDGMLAVARDQADEGAHLLDVSLAAVGRTEASDAAAFVARLRAEVRLPLVYDSTDPDAIETALSNWPGRAVVNSVNLEDGGERLDRVARLARRHGAALVALTIDEDGMARTADRKLACAHRLVDRLVGTHGFAPSDLLLDPLTFTLGSGDPDLRHSAVETLEALRRIKKELPGVFTWLGVSNVSFGLAPAARRVLNSVFLGLAVDAGLDAAILNAGKVVPLARIPEAVRGLAGDLILDRRPDALEAFLEGIEASPSSKEPGEAAPGRTAEERLHHRVLDGARAGLEDDLREALRDRPALDLVQDVLLRAMQVVGDRFGAGEMQLPFVLRSAEVVRSAVDFLKPELARDNAASRGTLVLATVTGDVHDIGKNLVDILLSNHGFRVVNLGIRQSIDAILEAARAERADAIGMSGLLVRSTVVMRDNLVEMRRRGISIPVLLGGAALDRRHVEQDLAPLHSGPVHYCADAFEAARILDRIAAGEPADAPSGRAPRPARTDSGHSLPRPSRVEPPVPRFLGTRVDAEVPLTEVLGYLDRAFLFRGQWQYRGLGDRREAFERERLEPLLSGLLDRWGTGIRPAAIRGIVAAGSAGDDIVVFAPAGPEAARFRFPRRSGRSLADFFEPLSGDGPRDILGFLVATVGPGVSAAEKTLFESGAFEDYFHLHGLGVAIAEATAEWANARLREDLGLEARLDPAEALRNRHRGRRYSFGYPGCPGLEDQPSLLALAGADRIGVTLTESFQMVPEQSVSAVVLHHPEAGGTGA